MRIELPVPDGRAYEITIDDPIGCDQFSARLITGLDPTAPTPDWMEQGIPFRDKPGADKTPVEATETGSQTTEQQ